MQLHEKPEIGKTTNFRYSSPKCPTSWQTVRLVFFSARANVAKSIKREPVPGVYDEILRIGAT
jgi:hypothetical protein